jgi:hypothetical protein
MLDLRLAEDGFDAVEPEDRPVFANEGRAILAVPAKSDGTLHIAFHRKKNVL